MVQADREKENVFRRALIFYKSKTREELTKPISVFFDDEYEIGIDAGGPTQEYLSNLLRAVNDEVFEGSDGHRIPIRTWNKCHYLTMAGVMVSHSILQKGPHFPVLAPYVYHFIHSNDKELAAGYIQRDDLPNTPTTSRLVSLINEVCSILL